MPLPPDLSEWLDLLPPAQEDDPHPDPWLQKAEAILSEHLWTPEEQEALIRQLKEQWREHHPRGLPQRRSGPTGGQGER